MIDEIGTIRLTSWLLNKSFGGRSIPCIHVHHDGDGEKQEKYQADGV
jgi:hypothetical protein